MIYCCKYPWMLLDIFACFLFVFFQSLVTGRALADVSGIADIPGLLLYVYFSYIFLIVIIYFFPKSPIASLLCGHSGRYEAHCYISTSVVYWIAAIAARATTKRGGI